MFYLLFGHKRELRNIAESTWRYTKNLCAPTNSSMWKGGVKILVVIMITVSIALTSFFVMKKAYDESQKEIEEENRKAEESISNLTVINVSKMKELFSSNDTKIIFVGSLTCPHCTAIKPVNKVYVAILQK